MSNSMLALPVSVEQVAITIRQMSPAERQRLFELAPELREAAYNMPRALDEARASAEQLRIDVLQALGNQPLPPDTPFLDDLTLDQYLNLPDDDRAQLWDNRTTALHRKMLIS